MIAVVVSDNISEITERMSSPCVFGDNSISITENIKHHLLKIKGVVDAKLEQNDTTRAWLRRVTNVVNDLFDLVDDLDLPVLPKQRTHSKIRSFFSLCELTAPRPLLQLKQMEKQLQQVAADATKLSLKNAELLTTSDAKDQEIEIVGREDDKEEIIEQILAEEDVEGAVAVVTIVGIEGIGKTKLAKFICDDERMKSVFDLMIWIDCIPDNFYAELVVKRMIESAMMKKGSVVMDEENVNLGEALRGSRFFLVLDDLRDENREEWLRLQNMLTEAAARSGGAVLITTQSYKVANIFGSYYVLEGLSEEDSWSLFEQIAGGGPSDSKITVPQKKMVKKCRGVPVNIIAMARLLSPREAITESEIEQMGEEFLQEVQLRYYNQLPSWHLKQCFAYSSFIFSTENIVKFKTIIRLWMAEGFLGPINSSSPREPEDFGLDCIEDFHRRSIFYTYTNQYGILDTCSMVSKRDLSALVAGDDNLIMDDPDKVVNERVRRVSLTSNLDVTNGIPKSLFQNTKKLRTILLPAAPADYPIPILATERDSRVPYEVKLSWSACDAIFCGFKRLRVLNLSDLGMEMLPGSIGELKSLRYLDLSHNNMKKLPNSIGELKHLQTLILSYCHQLRELPNDVNHFMSLRHLEMEECLHLTHMPSALKNLTWLRTLSYFVVSTHNRGLGELTNLNNLRGELEISHLERLKSNEQEQDGPTYLKQKQHLECLTLRWNHDDEDDEDHNSQNTGKHSHSPNYDQISLEHLEPHPNLQRLFIVGYEGIKFPNWLSFLTNLVRFSLYNCSTCKSLPPLDRLPELKVLKLERLDSLESITDRDDDDGSNMGLSGATKSFFPSLKELTISDCPNLTSWWKGRTHNKDKPSSFPSISKMRVKYCPKLDCMPLYPNLDDELVLECSSAKPLQETLNYRTTSNSDSDSVSDSDCSPPLSRLKSLTIVNVEEQSPLPLEWLKNFTSLVYIQIREFKSLKSLGFKHLISLRRLFIINCSELDLPSDEWEGLKNLWSLYISEIPKLESLPEGIKHLTSLSDLTIDSCPELTTLTEGIGHLKSLASLTIEECHKLASLPKGMTNLSSLNQLLIRNCSLLLPRCQKETGDDWPQIKHIQDISVKDTYEYYD